MFKKLLGVIASLILAKTLSAIWVMGGWGSPTDVRCWAMEGDAGTDPATDFLGTTDNQPLEIRVNNQRALRMEPHSTSPNIIGGHSANWVDQWCGGVVIAGGGSTVSPNRIMHSTNYTVIAGGANNSAGPGSSYMTIGGGFENNVRGSHCVIGGGSGNSAIGSTIGGGVNNEAIGRATIGGGSDNKASDNCFIGGGVQNTASGNSAVIGGGRYNTASGDSAVIGGGSHNIASGLNTTVGGGRQNEAVGRYATIGGGWNNTASGNLSTICGGYNNLASGDSSTILGGSNNEARGYFSYAAGRNAKALHPGSFVWGDSTHTDVSSTSHCQFIARASGGVYFYTRFDLATGVYLAAGGNSWNSISDRETKENFTPVDGQELLDRLSAIPIQEYNLKSQDPSIRHIGPVAQDFHAAFDYGESDRAINMEDADGVALAAIQALYKENQELKNQLEVQQEYLESLEARLQALENSK